MVEMIAHVEGDTFYATDWVIGGPRHLTSDYPARKPRKRPRKFTTHWRQKHWSTY